jgi:uncharacterized protein YidB (DUF937 family)
MHWMGTAINNVSGRPSLMKGVLEMLRAGGSGDGLSHVVGGFHQAGLGDVVSSWIGTGRNLPVSAEQLKAGLGRERVRQLAQLSGLTEDAAAAILAELLPPVIDHVTPEGRLPDHADLVKSVTIIKRALGV